MTTDLPLARRDLVAARLSNGQPVVAAAPAAEFDVSEDAVRRDLRALAAVGRCRRVYGGALPMTDATATVAGRPAVNRDGKRQLGRAGAATVRPGELVFVDSGSTHLAPPDFMPEDADVTVATNAIDVAAAVLRRPDLRLIVLGGLADPAVDGCVDAEAVQAVARLRIDRAFIEACSVSAAGALGASGFADATFKRALLATSRYRVVLATADKFEARTPHAVADLSVPDLLLLAPESDPALVEPCARRCRGLVRLLPPATGSDDDG